MTRSGRASPLSAFRFRRAEQHAAEVARLADELVAAAVALQGLIGDDPHIPPRTAAVRKAVASLAMEVAQVIRDAERHGWTVDMHVGEDGYHDTGLDMPPDVAP